MVKFSRIDSIYIYKGVIDISIIRLILHTWIWIQNIL